MSKGNAAYSAQVPASTASVTPLEVPRQTPAQRVRALQAEAKATAAQEVAAFVDALNKVREQAAEIAEFGDAVPVGIRTRASRVAQQLEADAQTIASLSSKGR